AHPPDGFRGAALERAGRHKKALAGGMTGTTARPAPYHTASFIEEESDSRDGHLARDFRQGRLRPGQANLRAAAPVPHEKSPGGSFGLPADQPPLLVQHG